MIDPFGREVSYLRVSVTDRCDFRCTYCMAENMTFLPKKDVLSLEELEAITASFIRKGVKKVRLTGGEPLVRKGIMELINNLGRYIDSGELHELTLTTNGSQLSKYAKDLYAAGVRRINVSVDTLDPHLFTMVTRWGDLSKVLEGLDAAQEAGLKIKINTVAVKGVNDHQLDEMVEWAGGRGMDLTFIETMPMGAIDELRSEKFLSLEEVKKSLSQNWTFQDTDYKTGGPADYVIVQETGQRLGFITPLSHNFCESCNRVRLTCTGMLYMCLGQNDNADLKQVIRSTNGYEKLDAAIDEAIGRKPKGHDFMIDRKNDQKPAVARHMSVTGG
ncbi:GTP 3',8-cyclase MoaA [Sneathiella sp. P13V-1]|uniref:GTP 3',8-cyclase MoaA n=1 Tax=Sneathiella sp. P13V-1 TaxID=2697366 RepID=UPI00187B810F|nr:GTP 3',8-cyclase MoaA [Sneathiella sp. P13V-1]MBE7637641.1 GTP 3',8-cyclase MoaA [Sneathiella sp. P13V-1]